MSQMHNSVDESDGPMSCEEALRVLAESRREDDIVVTNQMSARIWPAFSSHVLDFNYLSSTMGGAVPLGLGMALASPTHEVIVVSGDGSLLMNLGCLATVTASGASNLTIVLLDNGLYEVTGGQQTAGRIARVDYAAIAKASGFPVAESVLSIGHWRQLANQRHNDHGPRFYSLPVRRVDPDTPRCTTTKVDEELKRFRTLLSSRVSLPRTLHEFSRSHTI